jgi:hypothetical protein
MSTPKRRLIAFLLGAAVVTAAAGCGGSAATAPSGGAASTAEASTDATLAPGDLPDPEEPPVATTTSTATPAAAAGDEAVVAAAGRGGEATIDTSISLTDEEIEGLVFMREEEKLARDVYTALFEVWGLPVFDTIAASEQRHTDAVLELIEAHRIDDPVADDTAGVFTNEDLAGLYDELVARGSGSSVEALAVGALIEDLDIYDLHEWLEKTENPDIERVFGNLLAGSENHLRAFTSQLEANGAEFTPTYLDESQVEEILAAAGRSGGRGGRRGR